LQIFVVVVVIHISESLFSTPQPPPAGEIGKGGANIHYKNTFVKKKKSAPQNKIYPILTFNLTKLITMKKLSVLAVILVATCAVAVAQPRAIGGRLGWSIGPSYQHQIGEKNMIQADVDFLFYGIDGVQGTVTFNWIIPLVSVSAGSLNLYPGVGIGGGYERFINSLVYTWNTWNLFHSARSGSGFIGVAGMIGVEWNFKFPLQLSVEYRPLIGTEFYRTRSYDDSITKHVHFPYKRGLWASAAAIGVRYKFGGK
jgi:hypothetical protein